MMQSLIQNDQDRSRKPSRFLVYSLLLLLGACGDDKKESSPKNDPQDRPPTSADEIPPLKGPEPEEVIVEELPKDEPAAVEPLAEEPKNKPEISTEELALLLPITNELAPAIAAFQYVEKELKKSEVSESDVKIMLAKILIHQKKYTDENEALEVAEKLLQIGIPEIKAPRSYGRAYFSEPETKLEDKPLLIFNALAELFQNGPIDDNVYERRRSELSDEHEYPIPHLLDFYAWRTSIWNTIEDHLKKTELSSISGQRWIFTKTTPLSPEFLLDLAPVFEVLQDVREALNTIDENQAIFYSDIRIAVNNAIYEKFKEEVKESGNWYAHTSEDYALVDSLGDEFRDRLNTRIGSSMSFNRDLIGYYDLNIYETALGFSTSRLDEMEYRLRSISYPYSDENTPTQFQSVKAAEAWIEKFKEEKLDPFLATITKRLETERTCEDYRVIVVEEAIAHGLFPRTEDEFTNKRAAEKLMELIARSLGVKETDGSEHDYHTLGDKEITDKTAKADIEKRAKYILEHQRYLAPKLSTIKLSSWQIEAVIQRFDDLFWDAATVREREMLREAKNGVAVPWGTDRIVEDPEMIEAIPKNKALDKEQAKFLADAIGAFPVLYDDFLVVKDLFLKKYFDQATEMEAYRALHSLRLFEEKNKDEIITLGNQRVSGPIGYYDKHTFELALDLVNEKVLDNAEEIHLNPKSKEYKALVKLAEKIKAASKSLDERIGGKSTEIYEFIEIALEVCVEHNLCADKQNMGSSKEPTISYHSSYMIDQLLNLNGYRLEAGVAKFYIEKDGSTRTDEIEADRQQFETKVQEFVGYVKERGEGEAFLSNIWVDNWAESFVEKHFDKSIGGGAIEELLKHVYTRWDELLPEFKQRNIQIRNAGSTLAREICDR